MKVLAALIIVAVAAAIGLAAPAGAQQTQTFTATLRELNDSGVTGTATITQQGDQITVAIQATGLEANQVHVQHIHSLEGAGDSTCPDASSDADGDGIITLEESAPDYGPVQLALEPFPNAPDGTISFSGTFDAPDDDMATNAVVIHGMSVDGTYEGTLPVACGTIEATGAQPTAPAATPQPAQPTPATGVAVPDTGTGDGSGGSGGSMSIMLLGTAAAVAVAGTGAFALARRRAR